MNKDELQSKKRYFDGFFDIVESRCCSSTLTFTRATPESDYIRILRLCNGEPKTLKEMYPDVKSAPFANTVVALAKQGYLQKCTKSNYVCFWDNGFGPDLVRCRKVWYYTTDKGRKLIDRVLGTSETSAKA